MPAKGREHVLIPIGEYIISAGEVQSYFTEDFWRYWEIFLYWQTLEIAPYSGGFLDWPYDVVQALFALKSEHNKAESEKIPD